MTLQENTVLWQYFQEDTARINDKMWTIASSLYTILGTILDFLAKKSNTYPGVL